jgi:TolB protein
MGLEPAKDYHFALRTADGVPNWSALSNVVGRSTLSISLSRLTVSTQLSGAGQPRWSPDGQTILFCADWGRPRGHNQLYQVSAEGGEPLQLTREPESAAIRDGCWSPDGSKIAYISNPSGDCEIYIMDAIPGAQPHQLTHLGIPNLSNCAWSPDGTQIAYMALVSMDPVVWKIYIVPSTGGPARALIGADSGSSTSPAWSPDGSRIAFSSKRSANSEIYVVPAEGGEPVQLTDDPASDGRPAWSPDGLQIAFESNRAGNDDLWLISSDGSNPTQITFGSADEGEPCWSPDGNRIVFGQTSGGMVGDIWVLAGQEATGQ